MLLIDSKTNILIIFMTGLNSDIQMKIRILCIFACFKK